MTLEIILRDFLVDILRSRANAPQFSGCDTGRLIHTKRLRAAIKTGSVPVKGQRRKPPRG